jgi:hypothetical protein
MCKAIIIQGYYHSRLLSFKAIIIQGYYNSGLLLFKAVIIQGYYYSMPMRSSLYGVFPRSGAETT